MSKSLKASTVTGQHLSTAIQWLRSLMPRAAEYLLGQAQLLDVHQRLCPDMLLEFETKSVLLQAHKRSWRGGSALASQSHSRERRKRRQVPASPGIGKKCETR